MKKYVLIFSVLLIAFVTLALKSVHRDPKKVSYVIITHDSSTSSIYFYYGAEKPREEIELKKKEYVYDRMVDILNNLESKGYEFVSSEAHAYSPANKSDSIIDYSKVEITYTMKKVEL
jgi:hypothetical protein